jgi:APA family basic amino acid/polyamine antiporter
MNLFTTKSISRIESDAAVGVTDAHGMTSPSGMRRTLGQLDLTMMGIAAIIGAGIFAMVGKASFNGGPAVIFLFAFTALACAFSALCYAEFASRIPIAGSAYTYSYASLGEIVAWIIGWDLIVEYAIGNIAVAISWSDYFTGMLKGFGIVIPAHFTMDFVTARDGFNAVTQQLSNGTTLEVLRAGCEVKDAAVNCYQIEAYTGWAGAPQIGTWPIVMDLPALLITVAITTLVFIGIRESKLAGNVMTVLKVAVILLVIVLGAFYVQPENWSPFSPNGVTGVLMGVSAVFFAYIGFDALSTTAEECKNPKRDLPRAMIYSLIICTVLYCLLALVLTGMVSYTKLNVGDPLAFVFGPEGANLPWIAGIIAVSAVIALATVFLVFQIGQPRLWMAMSRDGLLPKKLSSIHPRFRTPWIATIVTGFVVAIPALFMNLTEVTDLAAIGTLFAFAIVCAGVLVKDKDFGRENRYVPYINSAYVIPALMVGVLGTLYYFNPSFASDFVTVEVEEGMTLGGALVEKIPMAFFIALSLAMTVLSVVKRLTLIPVLGLLLCTYLMTELGISNWTRFMVWMLIGMAIYFGYGYVHSNLAKEANRPEKATWRLMMASVGFAASAVGLAITAFTFVADFIVYMIPALSRQTIQNIEVGFFLVGLVVGIVGVLLERMAHRTPEA